MAKKAAPPPGAGQTAQTGGTPSNYSTAFGPQAAASQMGQMPGMQGGVRGGGMADGSMSPEYQQAFAATGGLPPGQRNANQQMAMANQLLAQPAYAGGNPQFQQGTGGEWGRDPNAMAPPPGAAPWQPNMQPPPAAAQQIAQALPAVQAAVQGAARGGPQQQNAMYRQMEQAAKAAKKANPVQTGGTASNYSTAFGPNANLSGGMKGAKPPKQKADTLAKMLGA